MKNYYEILEIDKNASKEVIEKSYKTLVKKYHPDLQPEDKKALAEAKIKQINEAYEILSNEEKKAEYDKTLQVNTISQNQYNELFNEKELLKNELNNLKNNPPTVNNVQNTQNQHSSTNTSSNEDYYNNLQNAMKKAYYDAYIQSLKDRGYTIKYKKTFKDYLRIFIAYLSLFIIIFLVWKIPFTKKILLNIYNSNEYLKLFIDIIIEFFASIINTFKTIFTFGAS